jgi:tRNA dimethylallyltransferase
MNKPILIQVCGTTAIGKTSLSIALAQHFNTEIISCDSRQFFKEMTIGTAVPFSWELETVPHHFIQNKSIFETYSVGDFERESLACLTEIFKKHQVVILVGGSGLYAEALINGLDQFPKVEEGLRAKLKDQLETEGIVKLQNQLKELDPLSFKEIDLDNPQRLIRALEITISSKKPFSSFKRQNQMQRPFQTLRIGLEGERSEIYKRIEQRVDAMMEQGLLQEVEGLKPYADLNALQTVGYKELFTYLNGEISLDFAVSEIKKNTRRFAKRQITWNKKLEGVHWFNYCEAHSKIIEKTQQLLNEL